jgi:hypothetical protein
MNAVRIERTKLARALVLRDAALTVLKHVGVWEGTSGAGNMKLLSADLGSLQISYRTPFQRLPQPGDLLKYRAAQLGLTVLKNLPYGLDVWAPNKVLNIEWDDKGNFVLVSLRRGAWETELITVANNDL